MKPIHDLFALVSRLRVAATHRFTLACAVVLSLAASAPAADVPLANGTPVTSTLPAAPRQTQWHWYYVDSSASTSNLKVRLDGLSADADLYLRPVDRPTTSVYSCRGYNASANADECLVPSPGSQRWWIGVTNYSTSSISYTIRATWDQGCGLSSSSTVPSSVLLGSPGSFRATASPKPGTCSGTSQPSFLWTFGESGNTSTLKSADYTYATPGSHTWTLAVSFPGAPTRLHTGTVVVYQKVDHFEVVAPVQVSGPNTPFAVKVIARNAANAQVFYTGQLSMSSTAGAVSPTRIDMSGGLWESSNVKLTSVLPTLKLKVTGVATGEATIAVTAGCSKSGTVAGIVWNDARRLLLGSTVVLAQGGTEVRRGTGAVYSFTGVPCGSYSIWAEHTNAGQLWKSAPVQVTVVAGRTSSLSPLIVPTRNDTVHTPIVLLPGMLGSSIRGSFYPTLPKESPADASGLVLYELLGLYDASGWRKLEDALAAEGYVLGQTIIECPYDWRRPVKESATEYLAACVQRALALSPGRTEVDIVAHSTGNLVARAYIQAGNQSKVRKFAMVAPPHLGVTKSYYMWEGGDPKLTDGAGSCSSTGITHYYTRVTEGLMSKMLGSVPKVLCLDWSLGVSPRLRPDPTAVRAFYRTYARVARDLLPTPDVAFLSLPSPGSAAKKIFCSTNVDDNSCNWTVQELNSEANTLSNGVELRAFTSSKSRTLTSIRIEAAAQGSLYDHGTPTGDSAVLTPEAGDETISSGSAQWTNNSSWDFVDSSDKEHFKLVGDYKCEIASFLLSASLANCAALPALPMVGSSRLSIEAEGLAALYVQAPSGAHVGISPDTGAVELGIEGSEVHSDIEGVAVAVPGPVAGSYQTVLKADDSRDTVLSAGYGDGGASAQGRWRLYVPQGQRTLAMSLALGASPSIVLDAPSEVAEVRALPYVASGVSRTRVTWTGSTDPRVVGYWVYRKADGEAIFQRVASITGISLDTDEHWAGAEGAAVTWFTVAAVRDDGVEGPLGDGVRNNDRDLDGVLDFDETRLGTGLENPDSDLDGLNDGEEVRRGTDPLAADTDQDGWEDGAEVVADSDPLSSASLPSLHCNSASPLDADLDGVPDTVEWRQLTNPCVKDNDVFTSARLFSMQQYRDFLSREGDAFGISYWSAAIAGGTARAVVTKSFFDSPEFQGAIAPVTRLYFAYFNRIPDKPGLDYWLYQYRAGMSLNSISQAFAGSAEFIGTYGSLDNAAFVTLVYQNVLGRAPDAQGLAYWTAQLNGGFLTRGQVMVGFSESAEYQQSSYNRVFVTMVYYGMLRRMPEQGGFDYWVGQLNAGASALNLINGFLGATEYRGRFLP